jgi:hypothetical protein
MVLTSLVCAAVFALLIYVAVKAAIAPDIPTTGGAHSKGDAREKGVDAEPEDQTTAARSRSTVCGERPSARPAK